MARKARQRSESGAYYIIIRSKDDLLFNGDDDADFFLQLLKKEKDSDFIEVFSYCLLNECIYLALKEGLGGISKNIMHILASYTNYYNEKYSRTGKLFNGRFLSTPLETATDILNATKQCHRIPLKHKLKLDYEWSSYGVYFKKSEILSTDAVILAAGSIIDFQLFTENDGVESGNIESNGGKNSDTKNNTNPEISDKDLILKIRQVLKDVSAEEIESLSPQQYTLLINNIAKKLNVPIKRIKNLIGDR